jgi:hypothetical protein
MENGEYEEIWMTCKSSNKQVDVLPTCQKIASNIVETERRIMRIETQLETWNLPLAKSCLRTMVSGGQAGSMEVSMDCMRKLLDMVNGKSIDVAAVLREDHLRQARRRLRPPSYSG